MKKILFTSFCLAIILTGYSQNDNTTIKAGALELEANIPQNPAAGTICWTGTEFLGFNGARWIPLNGNEADASTVPIRIWSYLFQFPREFSLIPENNDADSYTGTIEGTGLSLDFDHSFFNEDIVIYNGNSPGDIVTTNEIDGHSIRIIQPSDLKNDFTKITIHKSIDPVEGDFIEQADGTFVFIENDNPYSISKLTISVKNITRVQQEMLINIFKAVEIVEPAVPIEIGRYRFLFPLGFSLDPGQGIDSYVGQINGAGISLSYDYGPYTGPSTNLSEEEYDVTEEEIDGYFKQIVRPVDSQNNRTKIFMYNLYSKLEDPSFYWRLTVSVKNITLAQQAMIIDVFNNVEFID